MDFTVNAREMDLGGAMVKYFGPDKADVIYDCAGNDATMNQAIQYARKGSTIILVAVFDKMATVDLTKLNDSELVLDTSIWIAVQAAGHRPLESEIQALPFWHFWRKQKRLLQTDIMPCIGRSSMRECSPGSRTPRFARNAFQGSGPGW